MINLKDNNEENIEFEETTTMDSEAVELTEEQVLAWKQKWGKVFKTTVDGEDYIWRKLRRSEYVAAMSLEVEEGEAAKNNIYYRQEFIANTIVLFPTNIADRIGESAGLATAIADEAIDVAGFNVEKTTEL